MGASRRSVAPRVLHNPLAQRQEAGFSMIGKWFSNGWKKWNGFSNDWKNFSPVFQRLENFFRSQCASVWPAPWSREWDAAGRGISGTEMEKKKIVCAGMRRGSEWEDWMCRRDRGKRRPGAHGRHCLIMDARGTALVPLPMVTRRADFPEIGFFQSSGKERLPARG